MMAADPVLLLDLADDDLGLGDRDGTDLIGYFDGQFIVAKRADYYSVDKDGNSTMLIDGQFNGSFNHARLYAVEGGAFLVVGGDFNRGDVYFIEGETSRILGTGWDLMEVVAGDIFYYVDEHKLMKLHSTGEFELVLDFQSLSPVPSTAPVSRLATFQDQIVFTADDGRHGEEVWMSDGTAEGTRMLVDINPQFATGAGFSTCRGADPGQITPAGNYFYFAASPSICASTTWRSDGTEAGTVEIIDLWPNEIREAGNLTFIMTDRGTHAIRETPTGPEVEQLAAWPDFVDAIFEADGEAHMVVNRLVSGLRRTHGIWSSDGTVDGTELVLDLGEGASVGSLAVFEGDVYFARYTSADDLTEASPESGCELWRADLGEGTLEVVQGEHINPEHNNGECPESLTVVDGDLYFTHNNFLLGRELWVIRGDNDSAELKGDINNDGTVGFSDFLLLSSNFGRVDASPSDGDLNDDGKVDFADFLILSQNFNRSSDQLR